MSDVGTWAAVRAEIEAKLVTPSAITGVRVTSSIGLERLIDIDAMAKPALGIVFAGARRLEDSKGTSYAINTRLFRAESKWTVLAIWQDMRGAKVGTPGLDDLCEIVRDRLHYQKSALAPGSHYIFEHESSIDVPVKPGVIVRGIGFRLALMLGN